MNKPLKAYTKEETISIVAIFSKKNNSEEKQALADKLGRSLTLLSQKASYERKRKSKGKLSRQENRDRKINSPTLDTIEKVNKLQKRKDITVTHLDKQPLKSATINIGDALITIYSNSFTINDVKIDC